MTGQHPTIFWRFLPAYGGLNVGWFAPKIASLQGR